MQVYFPTLAVHGFSTASVVEIKNSRGMDVSKRYRCTQVKANKGEREEEDLLSKASRLRKEAEELEAQLRSTSTKKPAQSTTASSSSSSIVTPVYKIIGDSYWTFSYRFATEPESDDETTVSPKYGGKLTLHLKSDGFTDLIAHEPSVPNKALSVVKAWGWDLEKSEEDEKEYVLF